MFFVGTTNLDTSIESRRAQEDRAISLIREKLLHLQLRGDRAFRWRGGDVSRLEGLSDAVFAFSITLLVVSLDVPQTFDELALVMRGFFAFGLCFSLLIYIWYNHYVFFRRYGLEDPATVAWNGLLLFVTLFYIYPLKFLYVWLTRVFLGVESTTATVVTAEQMPYLMCIYSGGFVAIFLCFTFLYLHALRKKEHLQLDELEVHETWSSIYLNLLQAGIGVVSILIVVLWGGQSAAFFAGVIYALIGPSAALLGWIRGRRSEPLRQLPHVKARLEAAERGEGFAID